MPEIPFHPERHRPPAPRRGRKARAYELTANQISRYRLSPPPMGEFIWRRTNEVQLDPILEAVSGIVERGWVYYHRNGKQFLRPRVVPANPRTVYQVDQRERLTLAQREWKRLTATQRDGWGRYAQELWLERKGAETLARSGQNLFCGAQIQRMAWGAPMSHAVPVTGKPAFAYNVEEVVSPEGTFSFRLEHGQANPTGYKLLLEMTPACAKVTQKPLERMLTRAGQTDSQSFFDLAESGATYVLEQPRHIIRSGQRFGVRVTLLTPEGVRGKSRRFTLLRKDSLPQERTFGVVTEPVQQQNIGSETAVNGKLADENQTAMDAGEINVAPASSQRTCGWNPQPQCLAALPEAGMKVDCISGTRTRLFASKRCAAPSASEGARKLPTAADAECECR